MKSLFKKRLLVLLCLYVGIDAKAQSDVSQINSYVTPPPPNAAALARYGEIPVNQYTGIPSIEIPLFTAGSGQLKIPLSLSYHAGGIRVDEIASRTGLGWTLNTGGCVTRTVRGIADEKSLGYNNIQQQGKPLPGYGSTEAGDVYLKRITSGLEDGEADLYFFNFNGRAGRYAHFANGYQTIPYSKLQISDLPDFSKKIVDENGYIYEFTAEEVVTTSYTYSESDQSCPQAWYITKMLSPDGQDSIVFTYDKRLYQLPTMEVSETRKICYSLGGRPDRTEHTFCNQSIHGQYLNTISGRDFRVKFYYSGRTDVNDRKIDSVVYVDKSENRLCKFQFNYNYYTSANKLRLDSVIEYDGNGRSHPPYKLTYNRENELPGLNSSAQDHWGYHNSGGGATMIPYIIKRDGTRQNLADREADSSEVTVGMLEKIEYPTGGYTQFQFEGNDYSYINSSRLAPEPIVKPANVSALLTHNGKAEEKTVTFVIKEKQVVRVTAQISNCKANCLPCCSWGPQAPEARVEMTKVGGRGYFYAYGINIDRYTNKEESIELDAGTYELKLNVVMPFDRVNVTVLYTYVSNEFTRPLKYAGGARVVKITSYDGISHDNDIVRSYSYKMDDPEYSSGVIMEQPEYHYTYREYTSSYPDYMDCGKELVYLCFSSVSHVALGSTQGGVAGYQRVTEYYDAKDSSNKVVSYYTSAAQFRDNGGTYAPPFPPATSYDWRRGLLTQKVTYGKGNKLVSIEKKAYSILPDFQYELRSFKAQQSVFCPYAAMGTDGKYQFIKYKTDYYRIVTEWMPLVADTLTLYSTGSGDSVRTITTYTYDTSSLKVASVVKELSNRTERQFFRYPFNYGVSAGDNVSLGIKNLQQRHIVSPVVESYTTVSNNASPGTVSGQFVSYKTAQPYPDTVFRLNVSGVLTDFIPSVASGGRVVKDKRYEPLLIFDLYDGAGNVLQQHKANDVPESFVWGYGGIYPVAAVKGMSYASVRGLVNTSTIGNLYDDVQIRNALAPLRSSGGNALVNVYTFRPLVGMTSMTDPAGRTTFYEYDGFGRLTVVRDKDGKIVKQMSYQYQRPVTE
ncbi:YD repeat-containing protein [Chitinophaga eiseniae]|uniref:YD repeat-containing protein n=1 Tax=Chitinophaga eiseniae TaxID=634771 RepID=A0A1T4THT8_9BACT|nr:RHS repeat domain-containing protein [Chitinophaga eiseniae]SKA40023.1 YD repeat-containing protein [Chitinophaga eiseniae]